MTTPAVGYAAKSKRSDLKPLTFARRDLGPKDVAIAIAYCGVCHSDIHQVRDEWGNTVWPCPPGHEIVGRVTAAGDGDTAQHRQRVAHPGEARGIDQPAHVLVVDVGRERCPT